MPQTPSSSTLPGLGFRVWDCLRISRFGFRTFWVISGVMLCLADEHMIAAEGHPVFWKRSPPPSHSERLDRAGQPFCLSPWAQPSHGPYDWGYYVGGGAKKKGEIRYRHEGTWGLDYHLPPLRSPLGWYHGRRTQGGEGQYEPDETNRPFKAE
jgi:hypothetical protein